MGWKAGLPRDDIAQEGVLVGDEWWLEGGLCLGVICECGHFEYRCALTELEEPSLLLLLLLDLYVLLQSSSQAPPERGDVRHAEPRVEATTSWSRRRRCSDIMSELGRPGGNLGAVSDAMRCDEGLGEGKRDKHRQRAAQVMAKKPRIWMN